MAIFHSFLLLVIFHCVCVCIHTHTHTHTWFFIHSSSDAHLGCFYMLAIVFNALMSMQLLLLLSHFSPVRFCVTPWMAAHQAPLLLAFSMQECWSRLPFPSPMHECMLGHFSCVWLRVTLWTAAHQASLSTGFSRQEYWSGLLFPSPI